MRIFKGKHGFIVVFSFLEGIYYIQKGRRPRGLCNLLKVAWAWGIPPLALSCNDPVGVISCNDPVGVISCNDPVGVILCNDPVGVILCYS